MADTEEYGGLVPDSDLDRPDGVPITYYWCPLIRGVGEIVGVKPNDWLDLDLSNLFDKLDPLWGSSFQVIECYEDTLTVKALNWQTLTYEAIEISPEYITNVYIRAYTYALESPPDGYTPHLPPVIPEE